MDELEELRGASGFLNVWSELSDVSYTYTRATWSGHKLDRPTSRYLLFVGYFYMFPKYTLRWLLFYSVGKKLNKNIKVTEVRNPKRIEKIENIAQKYQFDSMVFKAEIEKRLKYWPLLK